DKIEAASLTKKILTNFDEDDERFRETPAEMVRRVCRVFGNAKNVVILNDEAHHCYAPAPKEEAEEGTLDADERTQAREDLKDTPIDGDPERGFPKELEGSLRSLYADYERNYALWSAAGIGVPPVFIVVCSNTATSKLVADWIGGWEKTLADGSTVVAPGHLPL